MTNTEATRRQRLARIRTRLAKIDPACFGTAHQIAALLGVVKAIVDMLEDDERKPDK